MVALTKNEEFSNRLNLLLDAVNCPPKNQGRARWFHDFIKKQLKINVSYEASRKWLAGDSIPYTKRIGAIAKGLNSSTEYLIGEEKSSIAQSVEHYEVREESGQYNKYTSEDIALLNRIHNLPPKYLIMLDAILDTLEDTITNDEKNNIKTAAN